MKTYNDCGLTGEQIANVIGDTLDILLEEFVSKVDINKVVQLSREKHPEVDEKAWEALGFGEIDQEELNELMKGAEIKLMLENAKTQLALAYTVTDDEEEPKLEE